MSNDDFYYTEYFSLEEPPMYISFCVYNQPHGERDFVYIQFYKYNNTMKKGVLLWSYSL